MDDNKREQIDAGTSWGILLVILLVIVATVSAVIGNMPGAAQ